MFTVALIGPDGAGKTTIARRLEHTFPSQVKYIYMGVNADASNIMLPTTRLVHAIKRALGAEPDVAGPRDSRQVKPRPKGAVKRVMAGLRSGLRLVNRLGDEWYRQVMAWIYQRRGRIVVFDRHYFPDYYAYDIAKGSQERPLSQRIHGFVLNRIYPKPDLMIYFDAPAEVLIARKGEGTLELLECRRQQYLQMRELLRNFVTVDATQPEDEVARNVAELIWDFQKARTGNSD